jgi:hypothetical protein
MTKTVKKISETLDALYADKQKESDDIKEVLKVLVEYAKETRAMAEENAGMLKTALQETKDQYKNISQELSEDIKNKFDTALKDMDARITQFGVRSQADATKMYERVCELRDGDDGVDSDPEEVTKMVLERIVMPNNTPILEEVQELKKEIEELKKRPSGRISGGGTSAMGVAHTFKYIAHTEEPTGDINGVNTVYEVKNSIFWIAGFTLNGEQIAELPNFTYSGRRITFSSAIPAAYSGKDFEVKYIGI